MKVVILAGGYGTRLAEETGRIPKPMVEIGGRPILWHIMKIYSSYGFNEFIICLGYKGYLVKEFFKNYLLHVSDLTLDMKTGSCQIHEKRVEPFKVTLIDTGEETQTGGRLKRVASYIENEPFFLTYGDGVADIDIAAQLQFHKAHGKMATVAAIVPPGRFGALRLGENDQVSKMGEKLDTVGAFINGGFFVLEPGVLDLIDGDLSVWEQEPMTSLTATGELQAYRHEGFWQAMDTLRDTNYLRQLWESGKAPWKLW